MTETQSKRWERIKKTRMAFGLLFVALIAFYALSNSPSYEMDDWSISDNVGSDNAVFERYLSVDDDRHVSIGYRVYSIFFNDFIFVERFNFHLNKFFRLHWQSNTLCHQSCNSHFLCWLWFPE